MPDKGKQAYDNIVYDLFLWVFTIVVDLFFREIHPRSTWRIPKQGPVLFVAAPHANQFVDPLILMRTVREDARRRIAFLIAEKSTRRKFVGFASSLVGAVPVGRALDLTKPAKGKIYLPDPENDPTLVLGEDTNFEDAQYMVGGLLVLPSFQNTAANAEIQEILGPNEIRLKKPFKGEVAEQQLAGIDPKAPEAHLANGNGEKPKKGTKFSVAPHVDQHAVYDAVFDRVAEGGCIGIFPEGGSHDRTELLPLKAGLAIMALGSLAKNPDCNVSIVPVGMNYFNAHKFRSRCVIEFGQAITVDEKVLEQYKNGDRRGAVGQVLNEVQDALKSVTLQAPDYDTLMLIQAVRRLYNPKGKKLPLPAVVELQRRFLKGYAEYKDDPRVIKTRKAVLDYNKQLMHIGVRDHQVSYAKFPWYRALGFLLYRLAKLAILSVAVIPGLIFFSPVFIAGKLISIKKSKEALAASSVKIKARDVVATWKILVSLALAPALNVVYTIIGTYWAHKNRIGGRVPDWVPLWFVILFQIVLFPSACFAALRFGEIGMDIFKSIRPLVLSLNPNSSNTLVQLRERRARLQAEVTEIVDELGPELFPDFDKQRTIPDQKVSERPSTPTHRRQSSESGDNEIFSSPPSPLSARKPSDQLPRNESFQNIGSVGFFASRPSTPNRSRSRQNSASDGLKLTRLTSLTSTKPDTKRNMEEVSKNLSEALRERRGRKQSEPNEFEFGDEEGSSEEDEEPTKKNI